MYTLDLTSAEARLKLQYRSYLYCFVTNSCQWIDFILDLSADYNCNNYISVSLTPRKETSTTFSLKSWIDKTSSRSQKYRKVMNRSRTAENGGRLWWEQKCFHYVKHNYKHRHVKLTMSAEFRSILSGRESRAASARRESTIGRSCVGWHAGPTRRISSRQMQVIPKDPNSIVLKLKIAQYLLVSCWRDFFFWMFFFWTYFRIAYSLMASWPRDDLPS